MKYMAPGPRGYSPHEDAKNRPNLKMPSRLRGGSYRQRNPIDSRTDVRYNEPMQIQVVPDTLTRLAQLGDVTAFEPAGDQPAQEAPARRYQSHSLAECITNVVTPGGRKPILKAMLTTACERNCFYCPFRAGRSKTARVTFTPDEMA